MYYFMLESFRKAFQRYSEKIVQISGRRIALITGAAHRVGKIFAIECAKLGFDIAFHYHQSNVDEMNTVLTIRALGREAYPLQADLCNPSEVHYLFQQISQLDEPLSLLINSAATMFPGHLLDTTLNEWQQVMDLNLRAPYLCIQEASKLMSDGGLIVNISDEFAQQTWQRYPLYGLTKSSLEHMTRILAKELANRIRVNALALGPILPPENLPLDHWEKILARSKFGRAITPDEIRHTLDYLLKNDDISGEIISIESNDFKGIEKIG
jgi:NAD(P)-dependent dehydrogenase (short-subunit alcohol dehydrogenase family)